MEGGSYSSCINTTIHHNLMIVEQDTTSVSFNEFSGENGCTLAPSNLKRYSALCLRELTGAEGARRKPSEAHTIHMAEREL